MKILAAPEDKFSAPAASAAKLTLIPLVAATYFMVAGGPYGLEDIVHMTGFFGRGADFAAYALVLERAHGADGERACQRAARRRRFLRLGAPRHGPLLGYQEVWLSLAGSVFEMALYPTLFVDYLGHFAPSLTDGYRGIWLGFGMIVVCIVWNILGASAVGNGSTLMTILLLGPFVVLTTLGLAHHSAVNANARNSLGQTDIMGAVLIAMWNYMGWDNTSTIAGEVDRPQRTFPLAMLISVLLIVITTSSR